MSVDHDSIWNPRWKAPSHPSTAVLRPFLHALTFIKPVDLCLLNTPRLLGKIQLLHVVYSALQTQPLLTLQAFLPRPNPLARCSPAVLRGLTVGGKSFLPWGICTRVLIFTSAWLTLARVIAWSPCSLRSLRDLITNVGPPANIGPPAKSSSKSLHIPNNCIYFIAQGLLTCFYPP